jgi:hypothetical protein
MKEGRNGLEEESMHGTSSLGVKMNEKRGMECTSLYHIIIHGLIADQIINRRKKKYHPPASGPKTTVPPK